MVANMQPPRLPVSETDRRRRHQWRCNCWDGTTQDQTRSPTPDQRLLWWQGLDVAEKIRASGV